MGISSDVVVSKDLSFPWFFIQTFINLLGQFPNPVGSGSNINCQLKSSKVQSEDVVVCKDSIHRATVCDAYWKTFIQPPAHTQTFRIIWIVLGFIVLKSGLGDIFYFFSFFFYPQIRLIRFSFVRAHLQSFSGHFYVACTFNPDGSLSSTFRKTDRYNLGWRELNQNLEALLKFLWQVFFLDFKEKVSYSWSCLIHRKCTCHADIAQKF